MVVGVLAHGGYIPHHRLRRAAIAEVLGGAPGRGHRSVASYDEDTTTMAVEAVRIAVRRVVPSSIDGLYFATATPAYLDKTNATAIHAALALAPRAIAVDMCGSVRSASGVWRAAFDAAAAGRTTVAAFADVRTGMPGGADERDGGDAGAAVVIGTGPDVIAEIVGVGSVTQEFLDRWRLPADTSSHVWEERFGEQLYIPLGESAVGDACAAAGIDATAVDHVIVTGMHARSVRRLPAILGTGDRTAPDLQDEIGNTGTAHAALLLGDVLDRAEPGEHVLLVTLADGADAVVLRITDAITEYRRRTATEHAAHTLRAQIGRSDDRLPYGLFLTWRSHLLREPPRREDPDRPMAPPANRRETWKFGFVGSVCAACGARHLPPQRVCFRCQAIDEMRPEPFVDVRGTVSTFTVDRLAYSPSPPTVGAVVDFDGGGRYQCEITDVDPEQVRIGQRVETTFRRLYTAGGIHDYFWKVRPAS